MDDLGVGDAVVAVMEWLTDDPELLEATEDNVYGHELPAAMAEHMPRTALVVSDAGGFTEGLPEAMDRARIDVRAYGATLDEAKRIAVLAARRMAAIKREVRNDMVLHSALRSGGYIPLREPIGRWPLVLRSYLVPYAIQAVA